MHVSCHQEYSRGEKEFQDMSLLDQDGLFDEAKQKMKHMHIETVTDDEHITMADKWNYT